MVYIYQKWSIYFSLGENTSNRVDRWRQHADERQAARRQTRWAKWQLVPLSGSHGFVTPTPHSWPADRYVQHSSQDYGLHIQQTLITKLPHGEKLAPLGRFCDYNSIKEMGASHLHCWHQTRRWLTLFPCPSQRKLSSVTWHLYRHYTIVLKDKSKPRLLGWTLRNKFWPMWIFSEMMFRVILVWIILAYVDEKRRAANQCFHLKTYLIEVYPVSISFSLLSSTHLLLSFLLYSIFLFFFMIHFCYAFLCFSSWGGPHWAVRMRERVR